MQRLNVMLTLPDGQRLFCGEIFTTIPDSQGKIEGTFRYTHEYLSHPDAFPLDPQHLHLGSAEIETERSEGVHGVFEDALPDDWGKALLARKWKIPRGEQTISNLLKYLRSNGLGALSFSLAKEGPYKDPSATLHDLSQILDTALKYDAGLPVEEGALQALFSCGSSPGGARPKALIKNKIGKQWIAKFPKLDDKFHVESIEAGTLQLAQNAGLQVPNFLIQNAGDRKVLLVERFDITEQGGRNHMISMQTLLGADGYYHLSYSNIFNVLNKYSCRPQVDTEDLFRQMVFNVAIGNTDDHLKNFCLLHTESGFCLSPAYDLVPDIHHNREHRLSFPQDAGTLPPGRKILERIGQVHKVSDPDQVIENVYQSVVNWQDVFRQHEVPEDNIQRLEPGITQRLNRIELPLNALNQDHPLIL